MTNILRKHSGTCGGKCGTNYSVKCSRIKTKIREVKVIAHSFNGKQEEEERTSYHGLNRYAPLERIYPFQVGGI